jgi:hypothetical protein
VKFFYLIMSYWGPQETPAGLLRIPFSSFSKQERLGRIADWTAAQEPERQSDRLRAKRTDSLFAFAHAAFDDQDFTSVERVPKTNKKPTNLKNKQTWTAPRKGVLPRIRQRYTEKPSRTASIKISPAWQILDELDFTRMANLHFEPDDPQDLL